MDGLMINYEWEWVNEWMISEGMEEWVCGTHCTDLQNWIYKDEWFAF